MQSRGLQLDTCNIVTIAWLCPAEVVILVVVVAVVAVVGVVVVVAVVAVVVLVVVLVVVAVVVVVVIVVAVVVVVVIVLVLVLIAQGLSCAIDIHVEVFQFIYDKLKTLTWTAVSQPSL